MKKLICFILLLCIPVMALAEDLSSMSYDDLVSLSQRVTAEIMSRPEWKEVTVPQGTYEIGKDIPAGSYSIRCISRSAIVEIKTLEGKITNKLYEVLSKDDVIGKVILPEGYLLKTTGNIIFAPPVVLGF